MRLKTLQQSLVLANTLRNYRGELLLMRDVTLALLRKGSNSMTHKLMRTSATDSLDAEGKRGMFKDRKMTELENLL